MAKKDKPQIHAEIGEDLHNKLLSYKSKRPKATKTTVVMEGLRLLFSQHDIDPKKDNVVFQVIDSYFNVPASIPKKSFYVFLYMLSQKVPHMGAVWFWGEMVYKGDETLTNEQVFGLIKEEISRLLRK